MNTWSSRALLALAGAAVALLALEIGLRLRPPVDLPLNNPYQLTRLVGTRQFRTPFHSYREVYPLRFDHDGYYARSDGAVDYHFDQTGGRWSEPRARDLQGDVGIVVGDSFTLGFGVRYEDTYVFKTEQALQERGRRRHFLNFAEPGADARASLRNYLAVRDQQPHDLVLFGLHLNDLIHFPTSYVAMTGAHGRDTVAGSRLLGFVARTLDERRDREAKIRELTDPAQLERPLFRDNMAAIEAMQRAATERGRRFIVVSCRFSSICAPGRSPRSTPRFAAPSSSGASATSTSAARWTATGTRTCGFCLRPASQRARPRGVRAPADRRAARGAVNRSAAAFRHPTAGPTQSPHGGRCSRSAWQRATGCDDVRF